jgi:hypothetical protein
VAQPPSAVASKGFLFWAASRAGFTTCRTHSMPTLRQTRRKGWATSDLRQIKIWDSISSMVYRPTIRQDICFVLLPLRNPFTGYFEQIIKQAALQAGITAVKAERYLRYSCCNPRHMGTNMAVPSCHCALRGENSFLSASIRVHQR